MRSLDAFAAEKLVQLEVRALRRDLAVTTRVDVPYVIRDGRRLVSFSCNDYFGLSQHPHVKDAAASALAEYGAGAGASRLVTGNHPLYATLEAKLARAKKTEAACIFGSGYLANIGVIGTLAGDEDLILIDELAHACLNAGAQLSRARMERFRHNDLAHLSALLDKHRGAFRHALIISETVFSMDGDLAPIDDLAALGARHDAWLLTDDAHGFGLPRSHTSSVPIQMGTLSKGLASYGGYVCASSAVVALVATRARSLIYSTALPPACVAAASAALDEIAAHPELAGQPLAKARLFAKRAGLPEPQSPIVPVILGAPEAALAASATLAEAGFLVTPIRPPTVPDGTARLRFAFSAAHADADILRLADVLRCVPGFRSTRDLCPASS